MFKRIIRKALVLTLGETEVLNRLAEAFDPVLLHASRLEKELFAAGTNLERLITSLQARDLATWVTLEAYVLRNGKRAERIGWTKRSTVYGDGAVCFDPQMALDVTAVRVQGPAEIRGVRIGPRALEPGYPFEGCALVEVGNGEVRVGDRVTVLLGEIG